jgi:2-polyprenyl-6-methoxyphenol hydroxylase-like FAD-dependent oxidoreductase
LMIEFERSFDVVVVGGGVAGIAAAQEAARSGLRTALVEKTILLGGLATTGLVNVYLPLCDGNGRQVTFGIAEELLHLSQKYGPGEIPPHWQEQRQASSRKRLMAVFSPASFVLALDEILESAGVDLWLDTLGCLPRMEGRQISGVEVETKAGRALLRATCVIDASGDADIAFRAGSPCVEGDNWLTMWAIQTSLAQARKAVEDEDPAALLHLVKLGGNAWGRGQPEGQEKMSGVDPESVTRFTLLSRRLLREHYQQQQNSLGKDGRQALYPVTLPAMAQFRTTRRIVGLEGLQDGQHGRRFDTSIGLAADWRKPGYVWEIPYGSLLPRQVSGLLVAGRCIDSADDAWEVTRVIPAAALTGQAAGLAASLSVKHNIPPERLPVEQIQQALRQKSLPYHLEEVGLSVNL